MKKRNYDKHNSRRDDIALWILYVFSFSLNQNVNETKLSENSKMNYLLCQRINLNMGKWTSLLILQFVRHPGRISSQTC